jgi:hypothetical protein
MSKTFDKRGWVATESTFSAAELAAITGMPLNLQRVWRSRGQLPGGSGKQARFSSHDVAEIMIRHHLALNGIPPGDSSAIGRRAAEQVLWCALVNFDGACEVLGQTSDTDEFLNLFKKDVEVAHELAGNDEVAWFLIRGDGGELMLVSDLAELIHDRRFISSFFIDLDIAAQQLIERAERPLFSVNVSPGTFGRRFRRVTNGRVLELVHTS